MSESKTGSELRCTAALSTRSDTAAAIDEVCQESAPALGTRPQLAIVFVSPHHVGDLDSIASGIRERTRAEHLLGCTGEAIVGGAREVEGRPALALWLAHLPGVCVRTMHLEFEQTPEGATFLGWPDDLGDAWPAGSTMILLGEPFSFPADAFLDRINDDHPGVPVVGGMASGAWEPGQNRLLLGNDEFRQGAVAALIHGPVRVRTVVSQGCRPIGRHFVVTRVQQNVIQELGGKSPIAQLQEMFPTLPAAEQRLVQHGLHVGRAISEYKDHFERGDFLVRNVIGADPGSGAIAIGDFVRPGQTVQFHIRDAETADEDLRHLLQHVGGAGDAPAQGALLFTCNGRGTRLFQQPNHDAGVVREYLGDVPLAGFFAAGELGPVGGKNFIHGFTASVVLFEAG